MIGSLLERKRSLMTLRMGGMTIGQLKAMVVIESLVPLTAASTIAAAIGAGIGYLFMEMVSTSLEANRTE